MEKLFKSEVNCEKSVNNNRASTTSTPIDKISNQTESSISPITDEAVDITSPTFYEKCRRLEDNDTNSCATVNIEGDVLFLFV